MPILSETLTHFSLFFSTTIAPKTAPPPLRVKKHRIEESAQTPKQDYSLDTMHLLINAQNLCDNEDVDIPCWRLRFILNMDKQLVIAKSSDSHYLMANGRCFAAGYFEFELDKHNTFILSGISTDSVDFSTQAADLAPVFAELALEQINAIEQDRTAVPLAGQLKIHTVRPTLDNQNYYLADKNALLVWALKIRLQINLTTTTQRLPVCNHPSALFTPKDSDDSKDDISVSSLTPEHWASLAPPKLKGHSLAPIDRKRGRSGGEDCVNENSMSSLLL